MEILNKQQLNLFNQPPKFSYEEQKYYFELKENLFNEISSIIKAENIAYFILQYGYLRATNMFYNINEINSDLEYIKNKYNLKDVKINIFPKTIYRYKKIIKKHLNIQEYDSSIKNILQIEAIKLAENFIHRKKIFYVLVDLSKVLNIEIPSYTELSKIISDALNTPKKRIFEKLYKPLF